MKVQGKIQDFIPTINPDDESSFGVSICTVDG